MTAAEARKKQWESLKDQPLRAKLKYIFTYYWAAILLGVGVIIFVATWIPGFFQPDLALGGYMFDASVIESYGGNIPNDFLSVQQLNPKDYEFRLSLISSTDSDAQTDFAIKNGAGHADFVVAEQKTYANKAGCIQDLRQVLTPEQLEKWKSRIVYIEKNDWDAMQEGIEKIVPELFMSTERMTNPVPFAIRLPKECKLLQAYKFPEGEILFGISQNSRNITNAVAFLEYILN